MTFPEKVIAISALLVPATLSADEHRIDPEHTLIAFELDHFGFWNSIGWSGDVTGTNSYDADDVTMNEAILPVTLEATFRRLAENPINKK